MTDIPKEYIEEATRRLEEADPRSFPSPQAVHVLARTLQELGWKPPVDPVEQRAKEIAKRVYCDGREVDGKRSRRPTLRA